MALPYIPARVYEDFLLALEHYIIKLDHLFVCQKLSPVTRTRPSIFLSFLSLLLSARPDRQRTPF